MSALLLQPITRLWLLCFSYFLVSNVVFGYYIQELYLAQFNFDYDLNIR